MLHTQGAEKNVNAGKKGEAKSFGRGGRATSVYVSSLSFLSFGVATDCFVFLHTDGNHTIFNIIRFIFTRFNIPYKHISTIDFITEFQRIVTRENGFGKSTSAGEREALDRTRSIFLSSLQTKGHIPCGLSLCNKNRNPQGPVTHKGKSKTGWAVLKFFKKYISLKNIGHAQSMEIFIKK